MIMHELKTGLQTSGCYAWHYPPCGHEMLNDKVIGRTNSTRRKVRKKFSNLLCLTEWGFYGHLEEDGLFYLNMDMYSRPHRTSQLSFSKLSQLQNETRTKQERSFVLLPCCASKRYLLSYVVGLTQLTTPREWSTIQITDPVGVKG